MVKIEFIVQVYILAMVKVLKYNPYCFLVLPLQDNMMMEALCSDNHR